MKIYRILEKKGKTIKEKKQIFNGCKEGHYGVQFGLGCHCGDVYTEIEKYIPRFIVQVKDTYFNGYINLKEFDNIEAARLYKLELQLEQGIVRE